jgi:hypothetical protein
VRRPARASTAASSVAPEKSSPMAPISMFGSGLCSEGSSTTHSEAGLLLEDLYGS